MKLINPSLNDISPYLDEIALRLWSGRASVMVGSGFSKNADASYPDWNQLGDIFLRKIYQSNNVPEGKFYNILKLAEEVESIIGRSGLENLIRNSIPDMSYEPSDLHVKLIELPWNDVFTTNYDTLLERSAEKTIKKHYDIIVNKDDIPYASRPRIIKLHGSFPSQRPLIITEEDYRRYPKDFAPFVNMVQQSLLENVFCLIGFSGDDPNFINWISWIQENLGHERMHKIYLLGKFNLQLYKVESLNKKGITPVDISCFADDKGKTYKSAYLNLFYFLNEKKFEITLQNRNRSFIFPDPRKDISKQINELLNKWDKEIYPDWVIFPCSFRDLFQLEIREWLNIDYGKIGLPDEIDIRFISQLLWRMKASLIPILSRKLIKYCEFLIKKYWPFNCTPPTDRYKIIYSEKLSGLNWNKIAKSWISIHLSLLSYYRQNLDTKNWENTFSLLNTYYTLLSDSQNELIKYENVLFHIFNLNNEKAKEAILAWKPKYSQPWWCAKRYMLYIELFDTRDNINILRDILINIRSRELKQNVLPDCYSLSREAYILFMIKFLNNAIRTREIASIEEEEKVKKLFYTNFENISTEYNEYNDFGDYNPIKILKDEHLNINEAWSDLYNNKDIKRKLEWDILLQKIREQQLAWVETLQDDLLHEIKKYDCDPWLELKILELKIHNPLNTVSNYSISKKFEFDINLVSEKFQSTKDDIHAINAFSLLCFFDLSAFPLTINHMSIFSREVFYDALVSISRYNINWALAIAVRLGDKTAIDIILTRTNIKNFLFKNDNNRAVIELIDNYYLLVENNRLYNHSDTFSFKFVSLLPEIISRLCCVLNLDTKKNILNFIKKYIDKNNYFLNNNIKILIIRLLRSLSHEYQYIILPDLLSLVISDINIYQKFVQIVNPFLYLSINKEQATPSPINISDDIYKFLFSEVANYEDNIFRINILVKLFTIGLLDESKIKMLDNLLWIEQKNICIPIDTDFSKFVYLDISLKSNSDKSNFFKIYVLSNIDNLIEKDSTLNTKTLQNIIMFLNEIIGSQKIYKSIWNFDDFLIFINLFYDILTYLNNFKNVDTSPFSFLASNLCQNCLGFIKSILIEVILPNLSYIQFNSILEKLTEIINLFKILHQPIISIKCATLSFMNDYIHNIEDEIINSSTSNDIIVIKDVVSSIRFIICDFPLCDCQLYKFALNVVNNKLLYSTNNSLSPYIEFIIFLITKYTSKLTPSLLSACINRLDNILNEINHSKDPAKFNELLSLKHIGARLAATLYRICSDNTLDINPTLEKWREQCLSNYEFDEIKNAWLDSYSQK